MAHAGTPGRSIGVDGQVLKGTSRLVAYANFVKVAHTVFALPFAVVGMQLGARVERFSWTRALIAVLAFAAARFAAMGFNRIADREFDRSNPRTAARELPAGRMSLFEAWLLVVVAALLFFAFAAMLNPLCLVLAPVALFWVLAYSLTKRFTALCHLWLGLGTAIAPVGGYLAITGAWSTPWWLLVVLAFGVALWVAGFDILYSLQDERFDREHGLASAAVALGARRAIAVARLSHVFAVTALAVLGSMAGYGAAFNVALAVASLLLVWEHSLVRPDDLSRLDAAFFTMNGVVAAVVMTGALVDAALQG